MQEIDQDSNDLQCHEEQSFKRKLQFNEPCHYESMLNSLSP